MLRPALSLLILGLTTLPVATDTNCDRAFRYFFERLSPHDAVAGERLASVHRKALRLFDACDAGHLQNIEPALRQLERS